MMDYCPDCEASKSVHIQSWLNLLIGNLGPSLPSLPYDLENRIGKFLMELLVLARIGHVSDTFNTHDLQPRLRFFIEAAQARGINCKVLRIGDSYTEQIVLSWRGRHYCIDSLPTASHRDGHRASYVNDKAATKNLLREGGFPVAEGRAYHFLEQEHAVKDALESIGFPMVVKPQKGTFGRHVTLGIESEPELRAAIHHATQYQPRFVVEKYVKNVSVHRVMLVDYKLIACAQYTDVCVAGDGTSTVRMLIDTKNANPVRTVDKRTYPLFWPVFINTDTDTLLEEQGFTYESIPESGKTVKLQRFPFLRWGADLIDETDEIHPENRELFERVMRYLEMHVGGIDVVMEDMRRPWREQSCAILEINSLPCIDMHHVPSSGSPRDVAGPLVDLFLKYYVPPTP